jgi:hypothetical protein
MPKRKPFMSKGLDNINHKKVSENGQLLCSIGHLITLA